jgi:3-hydroxyacyl-CoA dehydrogenase / enoyl-CoA hydratase / 3-hydroxybutyryl-CoA epimerase
VEILPLSGRVSDTSITMEVSEDGIVRLTLHPEASRPNLVTIALLNGLDGRIAEVEEMAAAGTARALVIRSARPGTFLAGVDLDEVIQLESEADATAYSRLGQRVLRRLERLVIPTVAAIDGSCVGAGLEVALACGYRVASDAPHTHLGLFHIRIGIAPAFGGTVRLPRLAGLQAALDLILSGDSLPPERALDLGLIDAVVPAGEMNERVTRFAAERAERGRTRSRRRRIARRLLEDTAPGRRLIFQRAARRLRAPGGDASPAAVLALEMLAESVNLPLERAFQRESELAGRLMVSEPSRALVHAFRIGRATRRLVPAASAPEHAAVLGAGDVGVELSFAFLSSGLAVRLRDRRRETLGLGIRRILSRIAEVRLDELITEDEADRRGARLSAGPGYGGFGTLDLVVAAEGEGHAWVRAALAEAADHTRDDCVLAFASPLLSADGVQEAVAPHGRVIGFHPVLPASRFPLVEIAPGERTDPATTAACVSLVRRLGRAAVIVGPSPATPATRILAAFFSEAVAVLEEGAGIAQVDRAAESFGFAMGPLRRIDALGPQRAGRYLRHIAEHTGEVTGPPPLLEEIALSGGFYLPDGAGARVPNPVLPAGLPDGGTRHLDPIRRRLLLRLINQAARLLEEGIVEPVDLELISLSALGFPRLRGGLLYYADRSGLELIVPELEDHAARFGERFAPAPLLQRLAANGGRLLAHPASSGQSDAAVL